MDTKELLGDLNSEPKYRVERDHDDRIDLDTVMNHPEITTDEPDWYDFENWLDNTPTPGFHDGKMLVVENAENQDQPDEVVALGPDDPSIWKKD